MGWSHGWSTKSPRKRGFWLFVTAISFCCLVGFIRIRIIDYLNSGVATSFSYDHADQDGLMLPQFTLCAMNSVDDTVFYDEVLDIEDRIFKVFENIVENGDKDENERLARSLMDYLWRRISGEEVKSFSQTPARIHNKYFFSKRMAEEFFFDRVLHGVDENRCKNEMEINRISQNDLTLAKADQKAAFEKLKKCYTNMFIHGTGEEAMADIQFQAASSQFLTDHFLSLLSKELVFEFLLQNSFDNQFESLPKMLREIITRQNATYLSNRGETYRTEITEYAWMAQLLNLKDKVIHGPHFIEANFNSSIATSSKTNTRINKPSFSHGLDPMKHIISVKFNGRLFDPSEVFLRYSTDISTNCITVRPNVRRKKFKQTYPGGASGLKLTLFTGYTGVAVEPIYRSLQRKPNFIAIIDDSDISDNPYPATHKTFNFYAGASTNFGLSKEWYNKYPKPQGTCDAETKDPKYLHYTVEACATRCFVKYVAKHCQCVPHYAANDIEKLDGADDFYAAEDQSYRKYQECRFEDLRVETCWRAIVTFKKNNEVYNCPCPSACAVKNSLRFSCFSRFILKIKKTSK